MFKKYTNNEFSKLAKQHNIFVLVGNGFDISILKKYNTEKMLKKTTSYADFFEYITYFNLSDEKNILYKKMKDDRAAGKENWSDFENSISELLYDTNIDIDKIETAIDEFQNHFTTFLNDLVDADILLRLNAETQEQKLAIQSFSELAKDIKNIKNLKFINNVNHYDLFYFTFANFNYTSLLDNYIYLDKSQFDPHKYKKADRNFEFRYQLPHVTETVYSSYIISEIIHPHGVQDIPRSILFGIDMLNFDKSNSKEKRLVKSYWSQYDAKYKSYIKEAELFIIYGMSLGVTDAWWFDEIFEEILNRDVELIIYMHVTEYNKKTDEEIKQLFLKSCIRHANSSDNDIKKVKENIHIVSFTKNNTYFLGLENKGSKEINFLNKK